MSKSVKLKEKNIRHTVIDGKEYFYVEDIKKHNDIAIIDFGKTIYVNNILLIKAEFVKALSDFDIKIKRALNFKPKS
ncbi:hypothetical protein D1J36_004130 [Riemerella anatipestifer]|uniref:hypothetical protein n=1 Tax=Riemerella anatipestifer TaxID=34085 RepID=UPI0012AE958C|nr:hypothetical protein [Riemerella anatipestifer]USL96298.1 hypothetical protein D1J36_004130 [Riemerella anatipestifer]